MKRIERIQKFLFIEDFDEIVKHSIRLLQENEPEEGYYGCFSGGKDSIVIKQLAKEAKVKVAWFYNKTTIDPPNLVKFIKEHHSEVTFVSPKNGNFFRRMEVVGFPTRKVRWCCVEYKESSDTTDNVKIMGIRSEESVGRKIHWDEVCSHYKTKELVINPIYAWSSDEVWFYIFNRKLPYCDLYDEGWHRIGCIGCPGGGTKGRLRDFKKFPKYERLWKRSFMKIWERRTGTLPRGQVWFGDKYFNDWEEMWRWWLYDLPKKKK